MDLENKLGLTALNTPESGERTELTAKEDLFMLTEIFMMATGPMTKQMDVESISTSTVLSTRDYGKTICSTVMESKHGLTSLSTRVITPSEESTESEATNGMMDQCIQATGEKTRYPALGSIHGLMEDAIKESGLTTTWRAWVFTSGTTGECTKANTRTTRSMDSEFTLGQTGEAMKGTGTRASSTVSAPMSCPRTTKSNLVCGKMGNALSGSMRRRCRPLTISSSTTLLSSIRQNPRKWLSLTRHSRNQKALTIDLEKWHVESRSLTFGLRVSVNQWAIRQVGDTLIELNVMVSSNLSTFKRLSNSPLCVLAIIKNYKLESNAN